MDRAMEPVEDFRTNARAQAEQQSWPGLLAQLIVDFTKVVEAEARLARASIEPALTRVLNRWLLQMMMVTLALSGVILMLCASVLLLHHWMQWWIACAATGTAIILVAIAGLAKKG